MTGPRNWFAGTCVALTVLGTCAVASIPIREMLEDLGLVLPAPTRLLLQITEAIRTAWPLVMIVGPVIAWALWRYPPRRGEQLVDLAAALVLFFMWYITLAGAFMPFLAIHSPMTGP